MYRKTIKFLGQLKIFLAIVAFTGISLTLGIIYPSNNYIGVVAIVFMFLLMFYVTVIGTMSISLDNEEREEHKQEIERHKQKVIAEHKIFINDVAKQISGVLDKVVVDMNDGGVFGDDMVIILVEILNRASPGESFDEK